jgi:hypothetical protein
VQQVLDRAARHHWAGLAEGQGGGVHRLHGSDGVIPRPFLPALRQACAVPNWGFPRRRSSGALMPTLERDSSLSASALCLAERWWCRSVAHPYREWTGLVDFAFHGRNTYAYLLAKYGKTLIPSAGGGAPRAAATYDLVSIQLYESFSHADFAISVEKARFPAQVPAPSPWPTRQATCKELTAAAPLCLAGASRAISAASYANADSGLDCRLLFGPCDRAWQGARTARSAAGVRAGPASGQFTGGGAVR